MCSDSGFFISTMYWADWGNHPKIETAAMDGTLRQTLVQENIQWPTGKYCSKSEFIWIQIRIIIHPHSVTFSLRLSNCASAGLAVDYFNERLYWADAKLSVIGSVRLDGSDPIVAVSGIKNSWVYSATFQTTCKFANVTLTLARPYVFCTFFPSRFAPSIQHRYLWGLHLWGHIY